MNNHSKITTEYNRKNTYAFTVRLNNKTDDDIIVALESVTNRNALIKNLLRAAINEPHASWRDNWVPDDTDDDGGYYDGFVCTKCEGSGHYRPFYQIFEFCPDCGAHMFPTSLQLKSTRERIQKTIKKRE